MAARFAARRSSRLASRLACLTLRRACNCIASVICLYISSLTGSLAGQADRVWRLASCWHTLKTHKCMLTCAANPDTEVHRLWTSEEPVFFLECCGQFWQPCSHDKRQQHLGGITFHPLPYLNVPNIFSTPQDKNVRRQAQCQKTGSTLSIVVNNGGDVYLCRVLHSNDSSSPINN